MNSKLHTLLLSGDIYIDKQEYIGRAVDMEVVIGTIGDEERVERYLSDHPSPNTW